VCVGGGGGGGYWFSPGAQVVCSWAGGGTGRCRFGSGRTKLALGGDLSCAVGEGGCCVRVIAVAIVGEALRFVVTKASERERWALTFGTWSE